MPTDAVLTAASAVDRLLTDCGENLILYGAGLIDTTFDQMRDENEISVYRKYRCDLLDTGILNEKDLVKDALQLLRDGR